MSDEAKTAVSLHKGQVVTTTIASLAPGGQGVSRDQGLTIFVNRVAPGDLVEVELFDVRKSFAFARVLRVLEPSTVRAEPPCKLFKVCGGCQWQHLSYDFQVESKADIVRQAIVHIGGLEPELVKPAIRSHNPLFYRNKVQFPVAHPHGSKRILAGYYKQDSHELVNIKHCPIQPEPLDRMLEAVKEACEQYGISAYNERTGKGFLRHITARYSFADKTILVTLVVNTTAKKLGVSIMQELAQQICDRVSEIKGVCFNFNSRQGNRILGDETICLAGQGHIIETLASTRGDRPEKLTQGLKFKLSPTSFFQVNSSQAVELLDLVLDKVLEGNGPRNPVIVDAYAGSGAIAMWLSAAASRVLAIEEYAAAVEDGEANLELNDVDNVAFYQGKVEIVAGQMLDDGVKPDIVVLDPPRQGVSAEALAGVIQLAAGRIIYVSCNPATLARDLKILEKSGYKTREIQPLDMFCQTYHVESVAVLDRV